MKPGNLDAMAQAILRDMIGGFVMQGVQAQAQVQILTAQVQDLQRQLSEGNIRRPDAEPKPTWQGDH